MLVLLLLLMSAQLVGVDEVNKLRREKQLYSIGDKVFINYDAYFKGNKKGKYFAEIINIYENEGVYYKLLVYNSIDQPLEDSIVLGIESLVPQINLSRCCPEEDLENKIIFHFVHR